MWLLLCLLLQCSVLFLYNAKLAFQTQGPDRLVKLECVAYMHKKSLTNG